MWKIVALQWVVGLCLSGGLLLMSAAHALSALWGTVAVALPSLLFALRLSLKAGPGSAVDVAVFLVGEILKIVATVLIMAIVAKWYAGLVWWAMLMAVVATIKSYFLIFLVK